MMDIRTRIASKGGIVDHVSIH